MLKVQSFEMSDSAGINKLLEKSRLAEGAHILVSEGKVIIPYEDGEPKNTAQKIVDIKEQKNKIHEQLNIIEHSQAVLDFLMGDADKRIGEAQANIEEAKQIESSKKKYDDMKELEATLKRVTDAKRDLENQKNQNDMEIARLTLNIELFDETITELEHAKNT